MPKGTKSISFEIKGKVLLKKCISRLGIEKNFLNGKVTAYGKKISTDFHSKKLPEKGSRYVSLAIIVHHG